MSGPLSAVVAGHICLDILPDFDHYSQQRLEAQLKPGWLLQTGPARISSGGAVSNTGLALQTLGIPTHLIARVGDDPFGALLTALIARQNADLVKGFLMDPQGVTSYSIIVSNQAMDRLIFHCPGANDTFNAGSINYQLVKEAALFHFGYPPILRQMYLDGGEQLVEVMQRAKATLASTSLDMNLPDPNSESGQADWRPIYKAALPFVDIFLPSLEELIFTLRRNLYGEMAARGEIVSQVTPGLLEDLSGELMDMGVKIVVIKMGSKGLYLRTPAEDVLKTMGRARPYNEGAWANRERWIPCFKVHVVGTTGSGDAAIAGFLAGLLRRVSIDEALTMAVAVGACNVEAADSLSGLKTWEATVERVKKGWDQLPLGLDTPGWNWDETRKMWIGPFEK